jgi:hypothetical protein
MKYFTLAAFLGQWCLQTPFPSDGLAREPDFDWRMQRWTRRDLRSVSANNR